MPEEKKPAQVDIYLEDPGEYTFRCPACSSLNINGPEMAEQCPDCNCLIIYPHVEIVDELEYCATPGPIETVADLAKKLRDFQWDSQVQVGVDPMDGAFVILVMDQEEGSDDPPSMIKLGG